MAAQEFGWNMGNASSAYETREACLLCLSSPLLQNLSLTAPFTDARESPPLSILIILDGPDPGVHGDAGPEAAAGEWLVGLAAWATSSSFMCSHPGTFVLFHFRQIQCKMSCTRSNF